MLFGMERALHITVDCNNAMRSGHFELQVSIIRDCVKAGEGSSSEQRMVTTVERDDIED